MPVYNREPCHCGNPPQEHYHEVGGDDWLVKLPPTPTPGLGGNIRRVPRKSPDIMGLKRSVYGWSAFIVLACLGLYIWAHWPAGV